jgi:predicted lipoprotein with Yx(FWY)xxD motif
MRTTTVAVGVLAAVLLVGCGDDAADDDAGATTTEAVETSEAPETEPEAEPAESAPVLATADSDFGTIVVDGEGMTAYMFDNDTQGSGESSCSGDCLAAWPAIVAESDSPAVDGVDGEVGTIERDDGTLQVTLDGWPLYLWAQDSAPGDVTGQAVNDVWWVIGPDGEPIRTAPASGSE